MLADDALLADMTQTAYRLGKVFGGMALEAPESAAQIRFAELFHQCFASVRLAIALKLRLQREVAAARRGPALEQEAIERVEAEPDEALETERPERFEYTERDRDRETERASFPLLLKTLNGVVSSAEALPGPEPAELPTLRELLARVSPPPGGEASRVAVPAQPRGPAARAHLFTSASAAPPLPLPGKGAGLQTRLRRATGPPRR
jgi:hypothetical protein